MEYDNIIQAIIKELQHCRDFALLDLIYMLLAKTTAEAVTAEPISA